MFESIETDISCSSYAFSYTSHLQQKATAIIHTILQASINSNAQCTVIEFTVIQNDLLKAKILSYCLTNIFILSYKALKFIDLLYYCQSDFYYLVNILKLILGFPSTGKSI